MNRLAVPLLLLIASTFCWADDAVTPPTAPTSAPASSAVAVPKSSIEVLKLVLCKNVVDREPVDEVTSAKVGDVVVGWSKVRSGLGEVTITHRWLHEGQTAADISVSIQGSPYRTWSRKTISDPGVWALQVLNSKGDILKQVSFTAEK